MSVTKGVSLKFSTMFLIVCSLTPIYAQQRSFPKDGNGLLDACTLLMDVADSRSSISSLNGDHFTDSFGQLNWCAGYLEATRESSLETEVNLALIRMMGVTLAGPDKKKREGALQLLQGACIPDNASTLQLARVLVKWLREHPEKLHELKGTLTKAAFIDAFPCEEPGQKEAGQPATPKP